MQDGPPKFQPSNIGEAFSEILFPFSLHIASPKTYRYRLSDFGVVARESRLQYRFRQRIRHPGIKKRCRIARSCRL